MQGISGTIMILIVQQQLHIQIINLTYDINQYLFDCCDSICTAQQIHPGVLIKLFWLQFQNIDIFQYA